MEGCWIYEHDVDDSMKDSVTVRSSSNLPIWRQTVENLHYQVKPDEQTFLSSSISKFSRCCRYLLGTMLTQNVKLGMKFPSPTVQCASRKIECIENNFVAQQFV